MNDSASLRRCLGFLQSCGRFLPPPISTYVEVNLDTASKVVNHLLFLMLVFNTFLVLSTLGISIMTFFAAGLLICQAGLVALVMNHEKITFVPRALAPTDFMVGFCLGLCIGGVILAFFTSLLFRRFYDLCKYAEQFYSEEDHNHACGNLTNRLWWAWLWCSLVFWSDLFVAFLIAAGRNELSINQNSQYQIIGGNVPEQYGSGDLPSSFQQQQAPPSTSFQQQQHQPAPINNNSGARIMPV